MTWQDPARPRSGNGKKTSSSRHNERPSWTERLIAALIAPLLFIVSVALATSIFLGPRGFGRALLAMPLEQTLALAGLPVAVGLALGLGGLASLMGHAFLTHGKDERNWPVTISVWLAVLTCTLMTTSCSH
ncbi:MAG TPA: hypothetical protein VGE47_04250 [Burkholderiaceae bacterium]